MGQIKIHPPVKLICAVTLAPACAWSAVQARLQALFGEIDQASDWYDFVHTEYYRPEMGSGLKKRMISFLHLRPAEDLPEIKIATNALEEEFSQSGRRQANLDPGYVTAAKLVLATTKDFSHRIYLARGIFGDLQLRYEKGAFQPQPWTYPDYREDPVRTFFARVRQIYLAQLAEL